jgi:hypothetical protein
MAYASRNIVTEHNKDKKMNGENYKIWAINNQCPERTRGSYNPASYSNRTREKSNS